MVAPIDAKASFEVEGETITLRLNFRSIALSEDRGVSLFTPQGVEMTLVKSATLLQSLAVTDHPDMSDDEALAIVVKFGLVQFGEKVGQLVLAFGGSAEGNVKKAAKKAA